MCVCVCVHVSIYMCVCKNLYIYTSIYMNIYDCIHTYTMYMPIGLIDWRGSGLQLEIDHVASKHRSFHVPITFCMNFSKNLNIISAAYI